MIKIITSDEKTFTVSKKAVLLSVTLKHLLEDMMDMPSDECCIPLPNVTGNTFEKILEYLNQYAETVPPQIDTTGAVMDDICDWDKSYMIMEQSLLFDVMLAANYLDIKSLLELSCKTVALMIKGKTTEEIRQTFGIENDFTPEEEEQIRKENEWCEEK